MNTTEVMIVEVNGIKYQSVEQPKKKPLSKMAQMALIMGGIYGIGLESPTTSKAPDISRFDFVKEYELIKNKKSTLSRGQRDYIVRYFESKFKILEQ